VASPESKGDGRPGSRTRVSSSIGGTIPDGAITTTFEHRVGFHETDAMGIVHHSNYLKYCENARVRWLETHDKSYGEWIEMGLQFAVTRVELDYRSSTRFDDRLEITTWLEWARGASLAMAYQIVCNDAVALTGRTEHASVNEEGRVRRIPIEDRSRLASKGLPVD